MKTPWQYAESGTEHAHQVALFQWCAIARLWGVNAANDPLSYTTRMTAEPNIASDCIPNLQWLHAIKNAGHGDAVRGNHSRAEGVKAGVPDIFFPVPQWGETHEAPGAAEMTCAGLYIELKRPKNFVVMNGRRGGKTEAGRVSDAQIKWRDYLKSAGYAVEVCFGWEAARDTILNYLGVSCHGGKGLPQV